MRYPPLVPSFTQTYQCDTPLCNISRDTCAIPRKTSTKHFCDTIAESISRDMKSIAIGPLRAQTCCRMKLSRIHLFLSPEFCYSSPNCSRILSVLTRRLLSWETETEISPKTPPPPVCQCQIHRYHSNFLDSPFYFQELISVIITPPITPNHFWGFNKRNSQERLHQPVLSLSGKITPSFTPKYSQGIKWRSEFHLGYTSQKILGKLMV